MCRGRVRQSPATGFSSASPSAAAEEQACAKKILSNLAHRAYRRPVDADDMTQLLALYKAGAQNGGFESGVRLALQKILVSPDFLFRAEIDPAGRGARERL